ncbi:hypothetical protein [Paraburkholderia domus]|uniref:hypothetical protein n=1 Tax=Paraburkholderia domus TaxID=2793075 RepID=UPI001911692C|nr:hypothetical protein [Paraburkholderia domus]MBK5180464.1 hypothetical protein [Burkholderia sp. R-69749]
MTFLFIFLFVIIMLIVPLVIDSNRHSRESILHVSAREFLQLKPIASIVGHFGEEGPWRRRATDGVVTGSIAAVVIYILEVSVQVAIPAIPWIYEIAVKGVSLLRAFL